MLQRLGKIIKLLGIGDVNEVVWVSQYEYKYLLGKARYSLNGIHGKSNIKK